VSLAVLFALAVAACGSPPPLDDSGDHPPGSGVTPRVVHFGSILPIVNETGLITLSQDGLGTNDPAGGTVTIQKPAGATVRKAFVAAASTGGSDVEIADGAVTVEGVGVTWDVSTPSAIGSHNHWADETAALAPILNAAPAGPVVLDVVETDTTAIDGVIVSVIFEDPNRTVANTIALLFGAQNVAGDVFNVGLAEPIDTSDPNLGLELGLGISYGAGGEQFSTVDVNGQRLSSAAGGYDDGELQNGALLTVGGTGDSPANPVDPNAGPEVPDVDDELYDLVPFVSDGATSISVSTANPS